MTSQSRSAASAPDVALHSRIDVRHAFEVYVFGRSRNIDPEEKRAAGVRGPHGKTAPTAHAMPVVQVSRGSVSVPERADQRYDRNAGTWRGRVSAEEGG